jgi:hypothetical protein
VLPDELETPPPEELELLDEELLELPEDELLDELELLELLELEDEALPELLLDDLPPHPASTAASSTPATSAQRVAAAGLPCAKSGVTGIDMVLAPVKT